MLMSYTYDHTHCTITTMAHTANVPFWPKLLKKIVAMGCPIGLLRIESKSVPMQKASATLIAKCCVTKPFCYHNEMSVPQPSTPAIPMA